MHGCWRVIHIGNKYAMIVRLETQNGNAYILREKGDQHQFHRRRTRDHGADAKGVASAE